MNPEQPQTHTTAPTPSVWRDLLIPFSIILAGACIGLGLYFSGGTSGAALTGPGGLPSATETTPEKVERYAKAAGVKTKDLAACLENGDTKQLVQADIDNALATGGRGTPWSVVVGPTGKTYPINGALPAQAVSQLIDIARSEGEVPAELVIPDADTDAVAPISENDWVKGDRSAAIKIFEYSDFDCPFCSRFHDSMNQIVSSVDDVVWVYRHFPLEQLHPEARYVAEAAECVGMLEGEDAFWQFTDAYFAG